MIYTIEGVYEII